MSQVWYNLAAREICFDIRGGDQFHCKKTNKLGNKPEDMHPKTCLIFLFAQPQRRSSPWSFLTTHTFNNVLEWSWSDEVLIHRKEE